MAHFLCFLFWVKKPRKSKAKSGTTFVILPLDCWNHWNHIMKRKARANKTRASKKKKREQPAKHWFMTNNALTFTEDDYNHLIVDNVLAGHLTWCMLGMHIGRRSKRIHMHAVIALKYKQRKTALIKIYPLWDIRPRRGSIDECKVYLSRDGEYREMGVKPRGSLADRWEDTVLCAQEHRIYDAEPMMIVKFIANLKRIKADFPKKLASLQVKKCHYWVYNPISDAGKTWYAEHRWPDFFQKDPSTKWWGGYAGEDTVIINNVTPEHMYPRSPLRMSLVSPWADTPAFTSEIKGEEIYIRPKRIVVTSQYTMEKIFDYSTTELGAASTRFIVLDLEHVDIRRIKAMLIMRGLARFMDQYEWIMRPYMGDVIIDL